MAVHFPRRSTALRSVALILLLSSFSSPHPGIPEIVQQSATYGYDQTLRPATPVQPQARDNRLANPLAIDAWVEQGKLTASDGAERDVLGSAAAISADVIVLGAAGDDAERGSAYVFVKPATGWADLTETAKLTASDGATLDWFGYSAAMDGDTIVIGAPGGPTGPSTVPGAAYIFVKPSTGWADMTQTAKLTASDAAIDDRFGISVAISGDTIVVGAGLDDVGMNSAQGSAYVFVKPSGGWADMTQTAKLTASDGAASDLFGWSVAVSEDTIAAGAFRDDNGANDDQGSAYVFVRPDSGWVDMNETARLIASDGDAEDGLGYSVALDGETLVAGANGSAVGDANGQGSAYVFIRPTGGWTSATQTAKLTASDGAAMDWFGISIALSLETVFVGAFAHDVLGNDEQGSAYVFDKPTAGWIDMTETARLTASDGAAGDGFGWSVAMDGDTLVAGAYTDSIDANQQGSAYVFFNDTRLRIYFPLIWR